MQRTLNHQSDPQEPITVPDMASDGHRMTIVDYNRYLVQSLETQDAEKHALLTKFDELARSQEAMGDVRLQLLQRTAEVHSLQRVITDSKAALMEEREKTARLIAENQSLLATVADDRLKISTLIELRNMESVTQVDGIVSGKVGAPLLPISAARHAKSHPVMVSISKRGAASPSVVPVSLVCCPQPRVSSSLSLRHLAAVGSAGQGEHPETNAPWNTSSMSHGSSSLVIHLSTEVQTLKSLLDEQRAAFDQERAARVSDERARAQEQLTLQERLSRTLDHLERMLQMSTKELVAAKHHGNILQRTLLGQVEELSSRLTECESTLAKERHRHGDDMRLALDAQRSRVGTVTDQLRNELAERDERHTKERKQWEHDVSEWRHKFESANEEAQREKRIRHRIEQQQKAEEGGRKSDIALLKQQLRRIEKRLYFAALGGGNDEELSQVMAAMAAGSGSDHAHFSTVKQPVPTVTKRRVTAA